MNSQTDSTSQSGKGVRMSIEFILGDYGAKRALAYREYGDTKTYSKVATELKIEAAANLKQLILSALPKEAMHTPYSAQSTWATGWNECRKKAVEALTALFEGEQSK